MSKMTDLERKRLSIEACHVGRVVGLSEYAWWKDGVQYVGTCGTTLREAIERADKEYLDIIKEIEA